MMIGGYPATVLSTLLIAHVIIPFYNSLQITTCYGYLECRFSRGVRTTIASLFIVKTLGYLGLVLYAPALALSTVTPVPIYATIAVCGGVATAYTVKGGMRAVVWVDFVQSIATIVIGYAVIVAVISSAGGFSETVHNLGASHRLVNSSFFKPALKPRKPGPPAEGFWCLFLSSLVGNIAQVGTDQIAVQRYLTTPDLQSMQRSVYMTTVR
eukprot:SAG22_NODE_1834_length_3469_cov_1.557864_4_plen_211_part_00